MRTSMAMWGQEDSASQIFYASHKKLVMLYARNLWINMMQWQNHNKGHKNWKCREENHNIIWYKLYQLQYANVSSHKSAVHKLESGSQTTPRCHLVTMATLGVVWEWDWYKTRLNNNMTWWTMLSVATIRLSRGTQGLYRDQGTVGLWGVPWLR